LVLFFSKIDYIIMLITPTKQIIYIKSFDFNKKVIDLF